MAEVLAIFGGVAGSVQMADTFLKLASELRHCIHTVRYAPQQIHQFRRDLSNFSASLRMFGEASEKGLKYLTEPQERKQRVRYIAGVFQECEVVKQGFKELLSRFFGDFIELPSFHGYLDRVRWYFGRASVAGLKMSLESAKSTITLFLTLHAVEFLHRKIDKLSRKSQEPPQDLMDALRRTKRHLKEQRKATRDAHQLLFEYFKANIHSNQASLVQDIRPIIQETRSIERSTTRTLRRESHRILRQSSTASTSQDFDNPGPSISPGPAVQGYQDSRMIPPVSGHISMDPENISSPPTPRSRARVQTPRALSPNTGNSPSVSETTENMHILEETSSPRDPSTSAISTVRSRSPPIFGPIIRDDGTRITVTHGEWRRPDDARRSVPEPWVPNRNFHDIEASASSLHHIGEGGEEEEGEEEEEENEKSASKVAEMKISEHGTYKAMPPFLDSDWKGVRRRPST